MQTLPLASPPAVRGAIEFDSIRVYINDTLHIDVQRSKLRGIGSWQWANGYFAIEFIFERNRMLVEYETRERWKAVLDELKRLPLHGE